MYKLSKGILKVLDLVVIFVMTFGSPMSALAQEGMPVLMPDKPTYALGDVAHITGSGFAPGDYNLKANGTLQWGSVTADGAGAFAVDSPALDTAGAYKLEAFPAGADAAVASVDFTVDAPAPTVQSDKLDYAPGELVTITGGNWLEDTQVHLVVNDAIGQTWAYDVMVDVVNGTFVSTFNLPNTFISDYIVSATGVQSGKTAYTSFTDAAALTLTKSASPLTYTASGQVIAFSYLLQNTGTTTLNGPFTVTDNKATVSCPATATLAPNASITCTGSYHITAADMSLGYAVNTATASSSNPGATTSNTDVRIVSFPLACRIDSDGANDVPGQKDLTMECDAPTAVNPLVISWNWDVISMSGSNSADACALFDTNNNGLADYALCASCGRLVSFRYQGGLLDQPGRCGWRHDL